MAIDPFDSILDEALAGLDRGEKLNDILLRYPADAGQLQSLLETATTVRRVELVPFSQRAAIRARLSEAARSSSPVPPIYSWLAERLFPGADPASLMRIAQVIAIALVIFVAGIVGIVGTVAAASGSAPGDVLYPVKQVTERIWTGVRESLQPQSPQRMPAPTRTPSTTPQPSPTQRPVTFPSVTPALRDEPRATSISMPTLTPQTSLKPMPNDTPHITPMPTHEPPHAPMSTHEPRRDDHPHDRCDWCGTR
jgi:hypothetical protein